MHRLLTTATASASTAPECARRLCAHMLAGLVSPCRGTITNLICLCGLAQRDWTADYRLYSRGAGRAALLFRPVIVEIHSHLPTAFHSSQPSTTPWCARAAPKSHGVGWKRDPLGPKFQTNLVRGQRYLQLTAAWPGPDGRAHMIPVDFTHAPTPPKPPKKASALQRQQYKEQQSSSDSTP